MTLFIRTKYRDARKFGHSASEAFRIAKVWQAFTDAESDELVKLTVEDDSDFDLEGSSDIPEVVESMREAIAAGKGPFGVIGEYQDGGEWAVADSVWGCVGYSDVANPIENAHVIDIMAETLKQIA